MIRNNFIRDNCDFKFLENIDLLPDKKRNKNSIPVYGFGWD